MNVYVGADHRGFALKSTLIPWLTQHGYSSIDCGNTVLDPNDDYPDFTFAVCDRVVADPGSRGIVVCGSGGGVVFAANKIRGIRCVPANDREDVIHNRDHNDANVLGIGSDHTTWEDAQGLIKVFLETPYAAEERFVRRLNKIKAREQ